MKNLITLLFTLVLFAFSQLNAQQSPFGAKELLIKFDSSTTAAEIAQHADDIGATEIWVSPITQTRLWTFTDFTLVNQYYNPPSTINGIIGTVVVQQDHDDIDDSGLNFQTKIDPGTLGGLGGGNGLPEGASLPSFSSICSEKKDAKSTNTNVKITIMDTGNNPTQSGIYPVSSKNYFNNSTAVYDPNGHGTSMARLAKESFEANSQYSASQVEWDIRLTHDNLGNGSAANILLALEEAAYEGSDIINMSFSYNSTNGYLNTIMQESIEAVEAMNVLIVASAGNDAHNNDSTTNPRTAYPSSYTPYNILSVGSYSCFDNDISTFSSFGEYNVDILAPGTAIESFVYTAVGPGGGQTVYTSGCSQATAITSGLALALGTMQSSWDHVEVKCAILRGREWQNLTEDVLSSGIINGKKAHAELSRGCNYIFDVPFDRNIPRERIDDENILSEGVFVYPNPAIDVVKINMGNFTDANNVSIINTNGQVVKSIDPKGVSILEVIVTTFDTGLYFVKINAQESVSTASFIIE